LFVDLALTLVLCFSGLEYINKAIAAEGKGSKDAAIDYYQAGLSLLLGVLKDEANSDKVRSFFSLSLQR
jgi:hypothetical protein